MKKPKKASAPKSGQPVPAPATSETVLRASFGEVVELIQQARLRAFQAVNTHLVDLYSRVGEYISRKLESAAWSEGVVSQLAQYIAEQHPDSKGFTRASLLRMRQLYDLYRGDEKSYRWCDNCRGPTTC